MRTRIRATAVTGVAALAAALTAVAPADAATATTGQHFASPADPCEGKSDSTIVRVFYRYVTTVPLRCGNSRWGYRHLVAGHDYDPSMISLTLMRGIQAGPGVVQYTQPACPASLVYRVVFNEGALNGTGVRPQGIITAYPVEGAAAARTC